MSIDAFPLRASDDGRTNVWSVGCECGRRFSPTTTMLPRQYFSCPRCGQEYFADWNVPKVEAIK